MSSTTRQNLLSAAVPLALLVIVFVFFGWQSPTFLSPGNLRNILVHCSSVAIVAVGMTIVLLTGGIDLSVGAIMFLSAAIAGKLLLGELHTGIGPIPPTAAILLIIPIGMAFGAINATLISACRMLPFVVTLATLYIGRGLSLQITETRDLKLPQTLLSISQSGVLGIPFPLILLIGVVAAAHILMLHTPFGRQVYALGNNPEAARKAGLRTRWIQATVYILSGFCAAVGGIVSVTQLGTVSPTFGKDREFAAIAAAVLGGTSLFGGRGNVFPGTLLGAVLIQSVESGLTQINANPYSYQVVIGAVIFIAVLMDRVVARRD